MVICSVRAVLLAGALLLGCDGGDPALAIDMACAATMSVGQPCSDGNARLACGAQVCYCGALAAGLAPSWYCVESGCPSRQDPVTCTGAPLACRYGANDACACLSSGVWKCCGGTADTCLGAVEGAGCCQGPSGCSPGACDVDAGFQRVCDCQPVLSSPVGEWTCIKVPCAPRDLGAAD